MIEDWTLYLPADLPVEETAPRVRVRAGTRYAELIDLNDPTGFGAVLRWWAQTTHTLPDPPVVRRWLLGETTAVDKLLVARACGELLRALSAEDVA